MITHASATQVTVTSSDGVTGRWGESNRFGGDGAHSAQPDPRRRSAAHWLAPSQQQSLSLDISAHTIDRHGAYPSLRLLSYSCNTVW